MRHLLLVSLGSVLAFAGGGGTVVAKGKPFLAEVAVTGSEKARGLMYRQHLANDRCMVFVGEEDGTQPIRTKNCLIALDVAWVRADGTVVETAENLPPAAPRSGLPESDLPSYGGQAVSRHYVQFAAGTLRRIGLKKGDRIGWDLKLDDGTLLKGGAGAARKTSRKK